MRKITLNELGRRIGESHPGAKLTDHEVGLLAELVDSGMSLAKAAEKMEVSKSCAAHIVSGRRRGQAVARVIAAAPDKQKAEK